MLLGSAMTILSAFKQIRGNESSLVDGKDARYPSITRAVEYTRNHMAYQALASELLRYAAAVTSSWDPAKIQPDASISGPFSRAWFPRVCMVSRDDSLIVKHFEDCCSFHEDLPESIANAVGFGRDWKVPKA